MHDAPLPPLKVSGSVICDSGVTQFVGCNIKLAWITATVLNLLLHCFEGQLLVVHQHRCRATQLMVILAARTLFALHV